MYSAVLLLRLQRLLLQADAGDVPLLHTTGLNLWSAGLPVRVPNL